MKLTSEAIAALIDEAGAIEDQLPRLKEIKAALAALAPGDYTGTSGRTAQVIHPAPGIKPTAEAIAKVRSELEPGEWDKLFFHVRTWKPVENFRAAARALLTPGKLRKIVALLEKPGVPYVTFKPLS